MSSSPNFVATARTTAVSIANADGTTFKTLLAAGAAGSRVDAVSLTNSDSANAYTVQVAIKLGAADYVIGEVPVPAGAGTNGAAPAVSLLDSAYLPALANTLNVQFLGAGAELRVRAKSLVSGSNTLAIVATGGDY